MIMTEGLNYLSVRIYRTDGKGNNLLEGSGTLFEDNGSYYVMTAYHCLSKKDDKVNVDENLNLTDITVRHNRKEVKVDIQCMVDKSPDNDWALISVKKPEVDWAYAGKLKLTNQINVGATYESYPYVSALGGKGRYTEVIPTNDEGSCHVSDDISTGKYNADIVLKGGSGAGIMRNIEGVLYCFGFMRRTLPQGQLNDIEAVCVDDIIPLLSKNAHKSFTEIEVQKVNEDGRKQQLEYYSEQISKTKDDDGFKNIVSHLLQTVIPSLIDSLQDIQALALLELIEKNCDGLWEKNSSLQALYYYDFSLYFRLIQNIDEARQFAHKAYELDKTNQKYKISEARLLWSKGEHKEAKALLIQLPDDNFFRVAVDVYEAEDQQKAFVALPDRLRQSYLFRYYLLDLYNGYAYPRWIVDDIDLKEPEALSLSSLPEWMFYFTCVHCRLQGIIPLDFGIYLPPKILQKGFDAGWHYFSLARGTKLEKAIPMLSALYYYWGFLLQDNKEDWYDEFLKVSMQEDNEINRRFYAIMLSSMLSMKRKYDDAYNVIVSKELPPDDMVWALVAGISYVSKNVSYLKKFVEYSKKYSFVVDSLTSESLVQAAQSFHYEIMGGILESLEFKNEYEKRLLSDYNKLVNGIEYTIAGYDKFMDQLTGILPAVAATVIYGKGEKEYALEYLKTRFEPGKGSMLEETYFKLLTEDNTHHTEYYFYLKSKREKGERLTHLELIQYYNYSLTLLDYDEALKLIVEIREEYRDDELSFGAYIDLLGKCRPEELANQHETVMAYKFLLPNTIKMVYWAFASNKYIEQAAEFLYEQTKRLQDEGLNNYYIDQTMMGYIAGLTNNTGNIVNEDSYVEYSIEDVYYCKKISRNTKLGSALLGRKVNETIEVELSGEKKNVIIHKLLNKYGYLQYSLMKSITEMGGNDYLHPLKVPDLKKPDGVKEFVKQLEDINREEREEYEKVVEQYKKGDNGLFALVNPNDIISSYYKLLFSSFEIRLKPLSKYNQTSWLLMNTKHRCVLDITSLLLLFEFSNIKGGINYKERFILPRYIYYMVVAFLKQIPILTSYDFFLSMKEGYLYKFSEDQREDVELRFKALIDWMEENCDIVTNPAILNVSANVNGNPNSTMFQYTFVELMNDGQQNMVLTEDAYIEKLMNVPLMIASTEAYIYSVEGLVRGREFTDFMVKNHNRYV